MARYILRRLLYFIPTLLAIYTVAFLLMHAAPGSPFQREKDLPPEVLKARMAEFHLDQPLGVQFVLYGWDLVTLRGHASMRYPDRNVIHDILLPAFPVSLALGICALGLAVVVGTAAGVASAARPRSLADYTAMTGAMIGISQPSFVVASVLLAVFAVVAAMAAGGRLGIARPDGPAGAGPGGAAGGVHRAAGADGDARGPLGRFHPDRPGQGPGRVPRPPGPRPADRLDSGPRVPGPGGGLDLHGVVRGREDLRDPRHRARISSTRPCTATTR